MLFGLARALRVTKRSIVRRVLLLQMPTQADIQGDGHAHYN
jgi:hypothetical protein